MDGKGRTFFKENQSSKKLLSSESIKSNVVKICLALLLSTMKSNKNFIIKSPRIRNMKEKVMTKGGKFLTPEQTENKTEQWS